MTKLLEKAFKEASKLSEAEQDNLAKRLLEELLIEKRWDDSFSESQDILSTLADKALDEFKNGKTELLEL